MKNKLLHLFGLLLVAIAANAQTWTAPTRPTPPESTDPVSGETYYLMNVDAVQFMAGGKSWYSWATSAVLTNYDNALQFKLTEYTDVEEGILPYWTFARTTDGKFTFISGANPAGIEGYGEMHVDMGTQGHNFFEIIKQENGYYHIRAAALDENYGMYAYDAEDPDNSVLIWEQKCWGWAGAESAYPTAVYATLNPAEGFSCDWIFIKELTKEQLAELNEATALYQARLALYLLAKTIVNEGLDVDYSIYTEVYEGTDIEAIEAATTALTAAIKQARAYLILKYGEDGINPPSDDNPADGTSLIENPSFDKGNISGWTCTFKSGVNANNVGYQAGPSGGYVNGDVVISKFIEAWTNTTYNPNCSWAAIGDGELSQTLMSLPAGKYTFTCDAIAVAQWGNPNPVSGVQLFATGGDIDTHVNIATGDGLPDHFEVTFVSTGGDVTLGLRTKNATANWIAADNFTLTYYGNNIDPWQVALQGLIDTAEEKYPEDEVEYLSAYNEYKTAYATALANAKEEVEKAGGQYQAAYEALNAAFETLDNSVAEYQLLDDIYNNWQEKINNLEGKWADISEDENFNSILNEIGEALDNCTYTSEQIAEADSRLAEAFSTFIGLRVEQGDNLSFLLNNPGFDDKDANDNYIKFSGWDSEWVTPAWGGEDVTYTDAAGEEKLAEGGNAEVYHAKFDIHQTIKHMPAGVFALSCKAFERDDNGKGVDAELYAIINGDSTAIQTVKVKNLTDEGSEVQLYDGTGGTNGKNADAMNGDKYIPNGMSGANVYFNEGFYENYFNIVLEEPADSVIIGIRDLTGGATWNSSGNWVLFDDFQIVFNGDGGDAWHPEIQRLIAEAEAFTADGAEYILTKEARTALANAIKNGNDEIGKGKDSVKEDAKAAIAQLQAAIELANNTIVATTALSHFMEVMDMRMGDELISTSDVLLEDVVAEVNGQLETGDFEDLAAIEETFIKVKKAFTNYVMNDWSGATETNPADVTPVIYNYDGNEYSFSATANGWDQIEGTVGYGNSEGEVAEFFGTKFEIAQTLYGLLPGWYRLGVQGFYRGGVGSVVKEQFEAGEELARHAKMFAGEEAETMLLGITNQEDMEPFTQFIDESGNTEGTIELVGSGETSYRIPDSAAQAANALQNFREDGETPLYQNYLLFEVKEGQETVTIGLRNIEEVEKDWCVWDNWSLLYYGTAQPTNDPTTAIQSVETTMAPVAIYNLAGQRVKKALKGVYIINGKKVVIK